MDKKLIKKASLEEQILLESIGMSGFSGEIRNPFEVLNAENTQNPLLSLLRLMSDPNYFYFTCKYLLNIDLLPFQCVILRELWRRPFPMLIGTRGLSKCVSGDTHIICHDGIRRIRDVVGNIPPMMRVDMPHLSLEGERGFHEVEYAWNNGYTPTQKITSSMGYSIEVTPNHPLRVLRNECLEWVLAEDIKVGDELAIDCTPSWFPCSTPMDPEEAYRVGRYDTNGYFPDCMLSANKSAMAAFIRGYIESNGSRHWYNDRITLSSRSAHVLETLQYVLLKFGVISKRFESRSHHYLLMREFKEQGDRSTRRHLFYDPVSKITNGEAITYDVHMKSEIDHSFISNGMISHNSFLLGIYSLLRAIFFQGRRIVITGAGFRQAKTVFNYAENAWLKSPMLQAMVAEQKGGPEHQMDRWILRVGDSTITALPLGQGDKIRGERAHDLINDEFSSTPRDIFETTLAGFGVVELDPVKKVRDEAKVRVLKKGGQWTDEMAAAKMLGIGNQTIISGTAYYQFNHFAEYWKKWHGIVTSQGDPKKLKEIMPEGIPDGFDYRDYAIIRMPVDMLPPGFMDAKQVARSKATVHSGIYLNEFGACLTPDTLVITDRGAKPIVDIKPGDKVLTHKGRFRGVTGVTHRESPGEVIRYRTLGYGRDICVTEDHPYWYGGDEWAPLSDKTLLANLAELSGNTIFGAYPLHYQMGLILGYYATRGVMQEYAHFKMGDQSEVDRLARAISEVFNTSALRVDGLDVCINDLGLSYWMAWACPRMWQDKFVHPKLLWSNPEVLRGFLDGCDGYDLVNPPSISLAAQIKMAASYFGISHAIEGQGDITNTGAYAEDTVVRKERIPYDGMVYNLHVEEDESYSLLNATVHNCFASDTNGFFKRSLIESCVTNTPIILNGNPIQFSAVLKGHPDRRYIYGIDPASEQDRFSIVVLEVYADHRRVVYCWTTTRQEHRAKVGGYSDIEADYYGYCARKIRNLMKVFPCEHIALDSQGGGIAVTEALHDPDKIRSGELPIWQITPSHSLSDKKPRPTDDYPGAHILELVNFADAHWTAMANHGMRKDFEDKVLLLPQFDAVVVAQAMEEDNERSRMYDTLEDAVMEIEELKDELATIVHTQTSGTNRDHWDTPSSGSGRKGRLRKDRYSALLMANAAARRMSRAPDAPEYIPMGGFIGQLPTNARGNMYITGPDWFTKNANAWGDHPGIIMRK